MIPMMTAIKSNDLAAIIRLHKEGASVTGQIDDHGSSPLHYAAAAGHVAVVSWLIEQGADVKVVDKTGVAALHRASKEGQIGAMELLLESGADVNVKNENGVAALHVAALRGHVAAMQLLCVEGANVNAVTLQGHSPLYYAAGEGKQAAVEWLATHGALISVGDKNGITALHYTAQKGHVAIMDFLVSQGAQSPSEQFDPARTITIFSLPLSAFGPYPQGACVEALDTNGRTPLYLAVGEGHVAVLKFLVEKGADVNVVDKQVGDYC
jgi:cytohesin